MQEKEQWRFFRTHLKRMDAELGNTLAKCESMLHDFTISLAQSLQPLGKSFLRLNRALIVFIENVVAAR
jgi:hypothetical protein